MAGAFLMLMVESRNVRCMTAHASLIECGDP